MVYTRLTNLLEDSLQGGEIAMNIIERSDPHTSLPLSAII
jgi:hypothetical protein